MSSSNTTTDHDEIRNWAESRGGRPSMAPTSGGKGKRKSGGVLRLDFGPKEDGLEETSWDDFFQVFDQSGLAFLYQDKTKDGKESRFNRFIHNEGSDKAPARKNAGGKSAGSKADTDKANKKSASPRSAQPKRDAGGVTKAALMEKARAKNVPGRSRMSKEELERAVA
jgi:hypothetical protein